MQVKIGGPEQAPGPHPFPYPRSIPPWRIRSIPLFHTPDLYVMIYIYLSEEYVQSDFTFVRAYLSAHSWMSVYMQEYVYYAQALWLCWQVCACSVCCVMVGMCLAVVGWQSKNGLLVTGPPSQPVAGLRLHHLQLLPAVAQLWCLMVEMRLAVASWQSKNCLLRYSRSKMPILIKMCCVLAELCWSGPLRSRPRSIPVPCPFQTRTTHVPSLTHFRVNKWQLLT